MTLNTAYHWRVDAVNACGATPGTAWAFTTTANHPPTITSTPPLMVNRTYEYDVKATDPDGDALAFSLTNAPDGMTIDAGNVTSLTWQTPTPHAFTATTTLVLRHNDGSILKIGNMTLNLTQGTITFAYADVTLQS